MEESILQFNKQWLMSATKKISSALATFVLIPASVSGSLVSSNEIIVTGPVTAVTINVDGQTTTERLQAGDVRSALSLSKVSIGQWDAISPKLDTKLNGAAISINVDRAIPVLIMDENTSLKTFSGYQDPKQILEQHKIAMSEEDIVDNSLIMDVSGENWLGQKIQIRRAPRMEVFVDNSTLTFKSWARTVKELLDEKKIVVGDKDKTNPLPDSVITNGIRIEIIRVAESVVKKTVSVTRSTSYQNDFNITKGVEQIMDEGSDGQKEQTYKVVFENGLVASETLIEEKVILESKARVIKRGTKPPNPGDYWNLLVAAGQKYGIDPSAMFCVMVRESGGWWKAGEGTSYEGLFQWDSSFYKWSEIAGYGGRNKFDPEAQIYATVARVSTAISNGSPDPWKPWPNTARVCGLR